MHCTTANGSTEQEWESYRKQALALSFQASPQPLQPQAQKTTSIQQG